MSLTVTRAGRWAAVPLDPLACGLPEELAEAGPSGVRFSTPGVLARDGQVVVVLPRGHRAPDDPAADALRLLRALLEYRRQERQRSVSDLDSELVDGWGEPSAGLSELEAVLLLWRDYSAHGALGVSEQRRAFDEPGRIHWPRTLRTGWPIEGRGGSHLLRRVTERVQRRPGHPLTALHGATALHLGHRLGLYRGLRPKPPDPRGARSTLDRFGVRQFSDRGRRVVAWLERLYQDGGAGGLSPEDTRLLFARRFHTVWERMLQVALGHRPVLGALRGAYHRDDGQAVHGLHLVPDLTVPLADGRLLLLDAKDYAPGHLPGTPDLTKQLLYRLALSDRLHPQGVPLERIANAFLLPGEAEGVRHVATHRLAPPASPALGAIHALEVDLVAVLDAWNAGRVDARLLGQIASRVRTDPALRTEAAG